MFDAKEVDFAKLEPQEGDELLSATGGGRGFAVTGGVAQAVVDVIRREHPDMEIPVEYADGLRECRKMLTMAKAGKKNGYLLEGMACPGGCVAGAGVNTLRPIVRSQQEVQKYKAEAPVQNAADSPYASLLHEVEE